MWEIIGSVLALLVILAPLLVELIRGRWGKAAQEKARREKENQATADAKEQEKPAAQQEAAVEHLQDDVERAHKLRLALRFKEDRLRQEFEAAPAKLREVVLYFVEVAYFELKIMPVVTRVSEPLEGGKQESGVHPAGRAVDLRDQFGGSVTYAADEVATLLEKVNAKYPRTDGFQTLIHHSANGDPVHWHAQIPYAWLTEEEKKRFS